MSWSETVENGLVIKKMASDYISSLPDMCVHAHVDEALREFEKRFAPMIRNGPR